jgi:hypothetical protein
LTTFKNYFATILCKSHKGVDARKNGATNAPDLVTNGARLPLRRQIASATRCERTVLQAADKERVADRYGLNTTQPSFGLAAAARLSMRTGGA